MCIYLYAYLCRSSHLQLFKHIHTVRHMHSHGKNSVERIIIQNNVMNYKWMRKTTNTSVYIEMKRRYNCICAYGSVTERKYTFIVLLSFKWILKRHTKNAKKRTDIKTVFQSFAMRWCKSIALMQNYTSKILPLCHCENKAN